MTEPLVCRRVRVHGRVQGVWFRDHTRRAAQELGIAGWVRNLPDGTVEAEFHGPATAVAAMVAWCHRGSPHSRVERVEERDAPLPDSPPGEFRIRLDTL